MIARNDGAKLSSLTNDSPPSRGNEKSRNKGWTEEMRVWYPTRGQIGNRSDPHGKHRNDARPFLINRQPLSSFSLLFLLLSSFVSSEIYRFAFEPFRIEFAPYKLATRVRNCPRLTFNYSRGLKLARSVRERVSNTFRCRCPCLASDDVTASMLYLLVS